MVKLFKSTYIAFIIVYVLMITAGVLIIMDRIPWQADCVILAVVVGIQFLLIKLSVRKYAKICDIADTDLQRFLTIQDQLAAKHSDMRRIIDGNSIVALINYELVEQAQQRIAAYGQILTPEDWMGRYMYSSYMAAVDLLKRDFSRMDFYFNDQRMCLQKMEERKTAGFTKKTALRLQLAANQSGFEAEFYSRSPDRLCGEDREVTMRYLANTERMLQLKDEIQIMKGYYIQALEYEKGVIYAVLNDQGKARECLTRVAQCGYAYPIVDRAKQWLVQGDVQLLMGINH